MEVTDIRNIKTLLSLPSGIVLVSSYLEDLGISSGRLRQYVAFGWLTDLGNGALIKVGDFVEWHGGVYALQEQERLDVHIGGLTAVEAAGYDHYLRTESSQLFLFGSPKTLLPKWFNDHKWKAPIRYIRSSFLPAHLEITTHRYRTVDVRISSPERAMLECLFLVPSRMDFGECVYLMESAGTFRPNVVSELLKQCQSAKVRRRFLHLAKKIHHRWLDFIDVDKAKDDSHSSFRVVE